MSEFERGVKAQEKIEALEKDNASLTKALADALKKLERSVTWSIEDFEHVAKENGAELYDESKFPFALSEMIRMHDAEYGICWENVRHWLEEECKR